MRRIFSKKSPEDLPRRRRREAPDERASAASLQQRYAFKRNQTLTGSASSHVRSLSEDKAHLKSERVKTHDLSKQRRHVSLILLLVVVIAGGLFFLINQFTSSASVVASPDSSLQLDNKYAATIEEYLSRQPLERFRFAVNQRHLNEFVSNISPEVKSVNIEGGAGFGVSLFSVVLRVPTAVWSIGGTQKYVDSSGVAFSKNYFKTPSIQIADNSGIQVSGNSPIASNHFLGYVGTVIGLTAKQNLVVTKVSIPSGTTRQIELELQGIGYPVKLSVDRPAGEQVEDMARAVAWMRKNNMSPRYIDVRVSGKAYYR